MGAGAPFPPCPGDCTPVLSTKGTGEKKKKKKSPFPFLPGQGLTINTYFLRSSLRVQVLIRLRLGANCSPCLWIHRQVLAYPLKKPLKAKKEAQTVTKG